MGKGDYDLQSALQEIYSDYPETTERPVIAITGNYDDGSLKLLDRYYKSIVEAGGVPVVIPPVTDKDIIINTLDNVDALLLSGGGDINPLWVGEEPSPRLHSINRERDEAELLTAVLAYNRQLPILGICRGIQTLVAALGGTLLQDIEESMGSHFKLIKHSQDADRDECTHTVKIEPDTLLSHIFGSDHLTVNSFHHQAVKEPGERLRICALAPDGTIEAVESTEHKPLLGVQWHPEWLTQHLPLFKWLVQEAALFRKAKEIHSKVITLDTHCDTPMFFPQGVDFTTRDSRIKVDLHKMTDGRQDATTMVAYLPQPKKGETFKSIAPFPVEGPKAYADLIFDKIEAMVGKKNDYLAIASTPEELAENKRRGKKSIMLGIENGLALEGNVDNVDYFAKRGVVYITLCHNGDNDICDSARRSENTHGGVSDFGAKVIARMNDNGVMVDLSHAGEKSFYDAIEISKCPIVCSHSNCKAVCDHERNLTDDQLRALAKSGGVAHITLYDGFVKKDGGATILDAMQHLYHAIDIMGIEHVGLGTDFDGDGGIIGINDSSEVINFTRQLLLRRFNEEEIAMIWGGNWLRLMKKVQDFFH